MSRSVRKIKNRYRQPVTLKELLKDEKKRIRLYLLLSGVLLIVLGLLLPRPQIVNVPNQSSPLANIDSFASEPVKVDKSLLGTPNAEAPKNPPVRIVIPSVQIDLPVKEAKVVNGYWEVFPDSAAFGLGSAYPEDNGNTVIFAHAREGLFLPLRRAQIGQNVTVFTKDKWYSYKIKEIKEVLPNQTEVIAPTQEAILTLYTCSGFSDSKRLIVTAERI